MEQKILIVDDAQEVLDLIQAMLEGQGYVVVTARNGLEGLEQARKEKPKMIIADVLMPEMDGFVFFKELRKDPRTAKVPVLILTARAKMEDSFRAMGVDGFLPKPIDANKLLAEVAREMSVFIKEKDNVDEQRVAPQTVDDLEEKGKPAVDAPAQKGGTPGQKKVVVFGYEKNVVNEISKQLEEKRCQVVPVYDDDRLVLEIEKLDPDIVFAELRPGTQTPMEESLATINAVIQKKELERFEEKPRAAVILYKVHQAVSGVTTMASDMADTENLLKQCQEIGFSKYLGLYSPFTFLMKIKEFLRK